MQSPQVLLAVLFFALNLSAHAEITMSRFFRLGEADAGAAHGNPAGSASRDSTGIDDLVVTGAPVYSAAVANSASSFVPNPYSCRGVTGYRKPILKSVVNSYVNQPNPFVTNGAGVEFLLIVSSRLTGLSTQLNIQAQVVTPALTLTIFNDCRQRYEACTIAAAFPTTVGL